MGAVGGITGEETGGETGGGGTKTGDGAAVPADGGGVGQYGIVAGELFPDLPDAGAGMPPPMVTI